MPNRILVAVAWPYANSSLHLGQIAGCYLPADIFARYQRLNGNDVMMVSGSDQHGTPITIRAEQEGISPQEIVDKYHSEFLDGWKKLGINFDLFTTTGTDNHKQVASDIFVTLQKNGYLYTSTIKQAYCTKDKRFLPDRYVEGICPHCKFTSARGDQCDNCGKPLNAEELANISCRLCGDTPEFIQTNHFFFKLSAFQQQLLDWVKQQKHWRPNVLNFTTRYIEDGLKDRAITRDIDWGIPIPEKGYEDKRMYVWFEAVIGYLSATKERAIQIGDPDKWHDFWQDASSRSYYFIGKDNIPFHTIIWPAMLMGYTNHNLPFDVPANEFLTLEGDQFSSSRNWAVWLPDYLNRHEPDPLRYYLSANMPESGDVDFSWTDFVRRNNDELVATYGNLVHRVLSFTYRQFDGKVPKPGLLDEEDLMILNNAKESIQAVGQSINNCHFREAVKGFLSLAQDANRYLDRKAPWKSIKTDRSAASTSLWVCINIISCLKTLTLPFLPFSAEKLHSLLGFDGTPNEIGWSIEEVPAGQIFPEPTPLFKKFDDSVAEEEVSRLKKLSN